MVINFLCICMFKCTVLELYVTAAFCGDGETRRRGDTGVNQNKQSLIHNPRGNTRQGETHKNTTSTLITKGRTHYKYSTKRGDKQDTPGIK
jgi:hypothetical protein